jgi:hypothetical protein
MAADLVYRVCKALGPGDNNEVKHMRKLAITLAVSTTLGLAGVAIAAIPTSGPFAGKTSLRSVNGFPDIVTFVAAKTGKSLIRFKFGTLGCFGTGAFPVGVDPYGMAASVGTVTSIPLSATGTFAITVKPKFAETDGVITSATIKGSVVSASSIKGTITISQNSSGDKCGPSTMKFTAVPGTPDSLGYGGP